MRFCLFCLKRFPFHSSLDDNVVAAAVVVVVSVVVVVDVDAFKFVKISFCYNSHSDFTLLNTINRTRI